MSPSDELSRVVSHEASVLETDYSNRFRLIAGLPEAGSIHPWQHELAVSPVCGNRLIRIPTGLGKTMGVLGAWLWNRIENRREEWPRRLVWCLPMRVLVEQVEVEIRAALQRAGHGDIPVHTLIGGRGFSEWHLYPEREAVLVGTQDMLLSRALNRGYAVARARWPMEFGLLNQDCLWVLDEVQLMDVGLATSVQLQAFRSVDDREGRSFRPCRSWWMSATIQSTWLAASPESRVLGKLSETRVPAEQRIGPLWDADKVAKPVTVEPISDPRKIAQCVLDAHINAGSGASGPTLLVVNRVDTAVQVFDTLAAMAGRKHSNTDLRLVHSRFRPAERVAWRDAFLSRDACRPGTDRIIIATQVVEAGVDISAGVLLTEIAPWASLVQRFGRCARWGGVGSVIVLDSAPKDSRAAAPYGKDEIDAARDALGTLEDVSPRCLEAFEENNPERLAALYPYALSQLLMATDLEDLFDTTPDLSGADVDVSRFIRSGDERDVLVFWRSIDRHQPPDEGIRPEPQELCSVPFLKAREWLFGKNGTRLLGTRQAWTWDWLEGQWRTAEPRAVYPGQVLLVSSDSGGYDARRGWSASLALAVAPVCPVAPDTAATDADDMEDDESLSAATHWQTIGFHGREVGKRADELARVLCPGLRDLLNLAGRWHDAGKVHPAFQASLQAHDHGAEVAKAPAHAWKSRAQLYRMPDGTRRRGFRHELASTLALFSVLSRVRPDHPALLGPWRSLFAQLPASSVLSQPPLVVLIDAGPVEREIVSLDAEAFDLVLYLVCSHHGKVRVSWHASPADQESSGNSLQIRGIRDGDILPAVHLADHGGTCHGLEPIVLSLAPTAAGLNPFFGRGWTERVLGLLERFGPFTLAWLEALIRTADQRASRDSSLADPAMPAAGESDPIVRSCLSDATQELGGATS